MKPRASHVHPQGSSVLTTVAENIRRARLWRGMTQAEFGAALAIELGKPAPIDKTVISLRETRYNGRGVGSIEDLAATAVVLGFPIEWFFTDHSSEQWLDPQEGSP